MPELTKLLQQLKTGSLTKEEREQLTTLLLEEDKSTAIALLEASFNDVENKLVIDENIIPAITNAIVSQQFKTNTTPVRRLTFQKWRYIAAAILILAIGSGIYYLNNQSYKSQQITGRTRETMEDIVPGRNKAIWTLANGKQIELDSIVLDMTAKKETIGSAGYNELRTPRGGQYQLVLPDGSKVWLNAASSIKYPVVFNGKERRVEVTGEAYFEIAKNVTQPFKVFSKEQEIEVLGTSFNINAYDDEPITKTTLITGSIKITNNNQIAILKPGQQANIQILSILPIRLIPVQTEEVLAWKNGVFNFNGLTVKAAMNQIARWYNVEIVYDQGIPKEELFGKLYRNINLQDLLSGFDESVARFKLEGKKLYVRPL